MNYSNRTITWLLVTTFLMLGIGALALFWVHHRTRTSDAKYQATQDSLRVAERRIADTVLVLQERAKVAAAQVAKTDTVYRERVKQLAGATIVTEHHDTIYLDTVWQVQNVTLACTQTIAARDTAMSLCEQRLAALRSLFVTDTVRRAAEIVHLGQEVSRQRRAGRRQGWLQGATAGAAAMLLVRFVLK